ncbi:M50 family metallopeptidase [Paenactinomyces guangxiensis]|uniref:M50 family metallopeptidase n=1 Tax=Paenactinomyces guangxiensis TaxID=1490290 RepID=A0A7W2A9W4_9BACL|nr:M50 family metallopeptidase [Paenactinomyces guangxiensis]MBA4496160.1 M50 family metallopeptidase [Paenactinomyces guangxiensis]MBH8593248.1 M50 family metallopeptidase [Paenactinomyces guangxiensis]
MNKYPWQGLRVNIHPFFWVLVCSAVWTGHFIEIITLFVLIIIHEMGHVTAAWSYGWRIHSMELLPFGGVAKMEESGTVPAREEIVVALAGPFHHVFMVLLSLLFDLAGWWSREWTEYFIQGNLMLACFNLLPVYPLDGGRVLQAALSYFFPYRQCIAWTLWLSLLLSLFMAVLSFLLPGNVVILPLLLIALFLFLSNAMALKQRNFQFLRFLIQRRDQGVSHEAMIKKLTVQEDEPLRMVVRKLYKEKYHVLEVIDKQGQVIDFLPEEKVLQRYFDLHDPRCLIRELIS